MIFELPVAGRISIGRDGAADISLPFDNEVSRLHAELELIGGSWVIADDGLSRNGTFVEGERLVGRRRLRDSDQVRIGEVVINFHDPATGGGDMTVAGGASESVDPARLSDTQRRVLIALCRPYKDGEPFATPATNREIAETVFLSIDAVKSHLRVLFERFQIGDLAQNQKRTRLAELALRQGIVTPRDLNSDPA